MNNYVDEYFKSYYIDEIKRKEELHQRLSLPVSIVMLLCGALGFFINTVNIAILDFWHLTFFAFVAVQAIGIIYTLIYLARVFHFDKAYGYVANPQEQYDYYLSLLNFYNDTEPGVHADEKVIAEFQSYLTNDYVKYSRLNCENNDIKSGLLYHANKGIIIIVIAFFISIIPYFIINSTQSNIQKVEIINAKEVIQMPDEKPTLPQTPKPPAQRPTPPAGRLIKESHIPKTEPVKKP